MQLATFKVLVGGKAKNVAKCSRLKLDFVLRLTVGSMAMSRIICRIHTQFIQASAKVLLELEITVFRRNTHREFPSGMMPSHSDFWWLLGVPILMGPFKSQLLRY